MASCDFSDGGESINRSARTASVEIFATEHLDAKFGLTLVNTKKALGLAVQWKMFLPRRVVEVPEVKIETRKKGSFVFAIVVTPPLLLQVAATE